MSAACQSCYLAGIPINRRLYSSTYRPSALATRRSTASQRTVAAAAKQVLEKEEGEKPRLKNYLEQVKALIESDDGDGPPRWFTPLECGSRKFDNSPLLLYLPGIDGLGLGLILQHQKLGKIFDVWCLHIPVKDRTPFQELLLLVEETVRSENRCIPEKPIYLVGESVGGCLALAVAARNPNIDLVLILANPATCFAKSQLQYLLSLLVFVPSELSDMSMPLISRLLTGEPLRKTSLRLEKGFQLEELHPGIRSWLIYFPETLLWKLRMMKAAASFANSRLYAVKAQILLLASGRDPVLPNLEEAERIRACLPKQEIRVLKDTAVIPKCEIRKFNDSGHSLFLEDDMDLVAIIKGTSFYRRAKFYDYVNDYLPPTETEFRNTCEPFRWISAATGPVLLSTLPDGKIVRGLEGIPVEGPVMLVGYHMLLGLELFPLVMNFLTERDILLRGLAHPIIFVKMQEEQLDLSMFDSFRAMGAVPVTASNFYKLLASDSHVLLYPGGMREACHKKGEEYQLFWPERSEFVRMAARFGAKIIPFGVVGEDDIGELVLGYEDQMKIPYLRDLIEKGSDTVRLRTDSEGEVANQIGYLPGILPKLPGRFYYYFGKPVDTAGMKQELRDRDKAHEVYVHIKSEVEQCISYLKEKREEDPYRSLAARTLYHATHGWTAEVPTFEI